MKKTKKTERNQRDELLLEYRLDYRQARPNRFASRWKKGSKVIVLDPDVAKVFDSQKAVNAILRSLLTALPKKAFP